MTSTQSSNRRRSPRVRRKLRVIIDQAPTVRAVTTNVSLTGVCLSSDFVAKPGDKLAASVVMADGEKLGFMAVVRWARKLRMGSDLAETNTMGLEFLMDPGPAYAAFVGLAIGQSPEAAVPAGQALEPHASPPPAARVVEPRSAPPPRTLDGPVETVRLARRLDWSTIHGRTGRHTSVLAAADLSGPLASGRRCLAVERALAWMEAACQDATAAALPRGSVGLELVLRVYPETPLAIGVTLTTTATVVDVDREAQTFRARIAITMRNDDDVVAGGLFTRQLAD